MPGPGLHDALYRYIPFHVVHERRDAHECLECLRRCERRTACSSRSLLFQAQSSPSVFAPVVMKTVESVHIRHLFGFGDRSATAAKRCPSAGPAAARLAAGFRACCGRRRARPRTLRCRPIAAMLLTARNINRVRLVHPSVVCLTCLPASAEGVMHRAGPACDLVEAPQSTAMPKVDWRRYHLSILFVDRCRCRHCPTCCLAAAGFVAHSTRAATFLSDAHPQTRIKSQSPHASDRQQAMSQRTPQGSG